MVYAEFHWNADDPEYSLRTLPLPDPFHLDPWYTVDRIIQSRRQVLIQMGLVSPIGIEMTEKYGFMNQKLVSLMVFRMLNQTVFWICTIVHLGTCGSVMYEKIGETTF